MLGERVGAGAVGRGRSVEELGNGSGEDHEGKGVHDDLLLVLIKNEESLCSGLAEGSRQARK
jgi:hypothetical protein